MSIQKQTETTHAVAPAAMRALTSQEMLAVVGGPEIKNGGGGTGIVATPPVPAPGS